MSTTINWALLVEKNRAKAHGIPWTEEEMAAIQSGISPDDVRAGILTKEDEEENKGNIERMNKKELMEMAKGLEIEFLPDAVTKSDLILEIRKKEKKIDFLNESINKKTKEELIKEAKKLKIKFDEKGITRTELIAKIKVGK